MKIIECPRDAMQGWQNFIPTEQKAAYLNALLKVGFDTLDFGSFVSPKAVPQMSDTAQVLEKLDSGESETRLLAIVANKRGAFNASVYDTITYLGFPLSLSETFQQRNTNRSREEALVEVAEIQEICTRLAKKLVVYLSMGFGNPYQEPYDLEMVGTMVDKLKRLGVGIVSLADTVGMASAATIRQTVQETLANFPDLEIGVHLHARPEHALALIHAAHDAGCRRFDGALGGFGGCPFARDELVGNIPTEILIENFSGKLNYNSEALADARALIPETFSLHH